MLTVKKMSLRNLLAASAMTFALSSGMMAISANAAFAQEAAAEGRQFGSKAGQIVNEALTFITSEQWGSALSKLNEALTVPELNPYERSMIYQMQGQAYYEQDQLLPAQQAFESAINAGGLLPKESDSLRVNIAQLMIGNGQFAEGAQMLENWGSQGGNLTDKHREFIMQAWIQSENYSRALPYAERWFNAKNPKVRADFDLLNFLYNNLGLPGKQADIVRQMINRWPEDKTLWDAWASMLANGGREAEAFEVTKMLYLGGALTSEPDISKVVQYYSSYGMPFQAAQILEKEMNAGRVATTPERLVQLADRFRQAREFKRALPILEKAAQQSGKAKSYADWGEALYHGGLCERAETAFTQAVNKGYDAGKSWSLIAACRYDEGQKEVRETCDMTPEQMQNAPINKARLHAIEGYKRVPSSSREGSKAKTWIKFINNERQAVLDRCEFEKDIERQLCDKRIELAYNAQIFEGGDFKLDDPACMKFKAEFDRKYKKTVNNDG